MRAGKAERTYADHRSIIFNFKTRWQDRVKFKKEPVWGYGTPLGDLKFALFTDNATYYLIKKVKKERDINKVHSAFSKIIHKAKFQSYNKQTITASKLRRLNDNLVWRKRIADLEKLEQKFMKEKEQIKAFKAKRVIMKGPEDRQNFKTVDQETGRVLKDLDDVLDFILQYNTKNMEKVPPDMELEATLKKKAEIIDQLLSDHNVSKYPDEIPWDVFLRVMDKVMAQKKMCFRTGAQ